MMIEKYDFDDNDDNFSGWRKIFRVREERDVLLFTHIQGRLKVAWAFRYYCDDDDDYDDDDKIEINMSFYISKSSLSSTSLSSS